MTVDEQKLADAQGRSSERARFPLVAHLLVWRPLGAASQVLLMRRANTGFADGWFSLPGGHVMTGETPQAAARRECHEEVGLQFEAADIQPCCVMPYITRGGQGVNFVFQARHRNGVAQIREPHAADELGWFDSAHLPERCVAFVAHVLANRSSGRWYQEFASPADYAPPG